MEKPDPKIATEIGKGLARGAKLSGIRIIGGETAFHLFTQCDVTDLEVHGRTADVIACGVIAAGPMAGRPFATKGGSVGPGDAVTRMASYLTRGATPET